MAIAMTFPKCLMSSTSSSRGVDWLSLCLLAIGIFCIALPWEVGQIGLAVVGAIGYTAIRSLRKSTKGKIESKLGKQAKVAKSEPHSQRYPQSAARERPHGLARSLHREPQTQKPNFRQPSIQPVVAPSFRGVSFEAQVKELLEAIKPTPKGDQVMKEVAAAAKRALCNFLPEADVVAYASADLGRGTAYGVAVPEVDIILNAPPDVLAGRLQLRSSRPIPHVVKLDARKLQKAALRACTDDLVASGIFKFRRSAFTGIEPKVTMLVAGFSEKAIPVDFSVNTVTPLYNTALLTECGQKDPCARDLILLVRRWAKDRGISHAAKGHLPPYAWTTLVIYFLQVRCERGCSPLHNLQCLAMSSGDNIERPQPFVPTRGVAAGEEGIAQAEIASLLLEFFHFYTCRFDWRNESVSVRRGSRQPPHSTFPLHIVVLDDGRPEVAPCIEDPFHQKRNLASLMTALSLTRLREELLRANELCVRGASLCDLLEPWEPPERGGSKDVTSDNAPWSKDVA